MSELKYPEELKYTKEHEWMKVEDGVAIIGISDFAQHQLTDVVFVELPEVGKKVDQFGNLSTVESVKSVSDIFTPIGGEIAEVNTALEEKPDLINSDCYNQGWIAKIKINDKAELDSDKLMSAEEYKKFVSESEH